LKKKLSGGWMSYVNDPYTTRISVICDGQKRTQKLKKRPEQRICGGFAIRRITAGWKLLRRFFGS
jgi:hypothetical protein